MVVILYIFVFVYLYLFVHLHAKYIHHHLTYTVFSIYGWYLYILAVEIYSFDWWIDFSWKIFCIYIFFIYIPFLFFYLLRTTFVYYLTRAQKKFKFYFPPVFKEFFVALLVFKLSWRRNSGWSSNSWVK